MTALAKGTQRQSLSDPPYVIDSGPQKGSTTIYQGSGICADTSGYLQPGGAVSGAFGVGVADPRDREIDRYDNSSGSDGDLTVTYKEGVFGFANDGVNPILATTQPMTVVYFKDDNTMSLSSSSGTRAPAGPRKGSGRYSIFDKAAMSANSAAPQAQAVINNKRNVDRMAPR